MEASCFTKVDIESYLGIMRNTVDKRIADSRYRPTG